MTETRDPWQWSDTQAEKISATFERLSQQIALAEDAMLEQTGCRAEQLTATATLQRARQNLRQGLGNLVLLLELVDLTQDERAEWSPSYLPIGGGVANERP